PDKPLHRSRHEPLPLSRPPAPPARRRVAAIAGKDRGRADDGRSCQSRAPPATRAVDPRSARAEGCRPYGRRPRSESRVIGLLLAEIGCDGVVQEQVQVVFEFIVIRRDPQSEAQTSFDIIQEIIAITAKLTRRTVSSNVDEGRATRPSRAPPARPARLPSIASTSKPCSASNSECRPTPQPKSSTRLAPCACNSGRIAATAGCGSSQSARPSLVAQRNACPKPRQPSTIPRGRSPSPPPPSRQTMPSCFSCATAAASRPSQSDSTSVECSPSSGAASTLVGTPSNRTGQVGITILRSPCVICCT